MSNGVEAARDRRNLLERIGAKIPGFKGYLERESRREVDKLQRDWVAGQVDRARQGLNRKIQDWSRSGNLANLDLASRLEKLLDRFGNRIRHADYGFSGFFDAVKIGEAELERLYEFDLHLCSIVENMAAGIEGLPSSASEPELRAMLETAEQADKTFDQRATLFEEVTREGGR